MNTTHKRGLSYREAMVYVGVKRRTFDEVWRPQLVAMPQGSSLIFDRQDLDRLFEQFKHEAAGQREDDGGGADARTAANDDAAPAAQNAPRNGRPIVTKGAHTWANKRGASSPTTEKGSGRSTSGIAAIDFASVASAVMKKRKGG